MTTIVTRSGKGSALTHTEMDTNFTNLNSDKSETTHNHSLDTLSNVTITTNSAGEILKWSGTAWINNTLSEAGIYASSNPAGYTTNTGTVTSVGGTGTVSGLTLTGTVTTSGNLTLGGTLAVATTAISSGNLGSGVVPYATASSTASAFKVSFVNTTGATSGNFGILFDSGASEFTYNPSTNTLSVGSITEGGTALSSKYYLATNPSGYTSNAGTVTSVSGTGTVSGITLSGTVTGSGNLTLGGTLSVAAADIASGNLGSGVLPYATASAAASAFQVPFLNTTGVASGNFGLLLDSASPLTYTPSTGTLAAVAFTENGTALSSKYYLASNPSGYTTNTGTVTSVGTGTGLSGGAITGSGTISLALNNLSEKTGNLVGTDRLVGLSGTTHFSETISAIPLSIFSNDSGWTSNAGTVTSVSGTGSVGGLTLSGTVTGSGSLTLGGSLTQFGSVTAGIVPASGGGTTNYLRADGTWTAPSATVSSLGNVGDVTITSNTSGEILKWDGSAWVNNTLAEAGILGLGGGTMTGTITSTNITPATNSTYLLGTSSFRYTAAYADYVYAYNTLSLSGSPTTVSGNATASGTWTFSSNTAPTVRATSGTTQYTVGYRQLPQDSGTTITAATVGKHHYNSTGVSTATGMSVGDSWTIVNSGTANMTITQAASTTMYLAGTATTGNRTLAQKGVAFLICVASNVFIISGTGVT